jgi:PKD repeat protein
MSIKTIVIAVIIMLAISCKKEDSAPIPIAGFFVETLSCSNGLCEVSLYDDSENAVSWDWRVQNQNVSNLENCTISLVQGVVYEVKLVVKNSDGVEAVKIKNVPI